MRDNIELAPGFIGIVGGPRNDSACERSLTQPLILDIDALVALAEINRRMRLPIGVRVRAVAAEGRDHRADRDVGLALDLRAGRPRRSVTDVRRRLRERDALSRADALAQKIRIARRDDRARNPQNPCRYRNPRLAEPEPDPLPEPPPIVTAPATPPVSDRPPCGKLNAGRPGSGKVGLT